MTAMMMTVQCGICGTHHFIINFVCRDKQKIALCLLVMMTKYFFFQFVLLLVGRYIKQKKRQVLPPLLTDTRDTDRHSRHHTTRSKQRHIRKEKKRGKHYTRESVCASFAFARHAENENTMFKEGLSPVRLGHWRTSVMMLICVRRRRRRRQLLLIVRASDRQESCDFFFV